MAVAVFNLTAFLIRYPEFAAFNMANPGTLSADFDEAGIYLTNDDCSIVQDVKRRGVLLNMLTAHIAFLGGALSADGLPRPVGRVSQAAEGSVSASLDYGAPATGSEAWYIQSPYGAAFWAATVNLRSFHYRPRPTNAFGNGGDEVFANRWRNRGNF